MSLADIIFPRKCVACKKGGRYVCTLCLSKVRLARGICFECAKPSIDGMTHIRCQKPWGLDGAMSLWRYEGIIRKALLGMKYKFAFDIAKELSNETCSFLCEKDIVLPTGCVCVPIPLHKRRMNWRGFNQTEEIGKLVSKRMGWDFQPLLVERIIFKKPQTQLKGEERRKNIKGAFRINKKHRKLLSGKTVILFDDIYTTGSTLREVGKVLKRSGAKKVWGLTVAR